MHSAWARTERERERETTQAIGQQHTVHSFGSNDIYFGTADKGLSLEVYLLHIDLFYLLWGGTFQCPSTLGIIRSRACSRPALEAVAALALKLA